MLHGNMIKTQAEKIKNILIVRIQSKTAKKNDRQTPKDSFAARAQAAADKNEKKNQNAGKEEIIKMD